MKSVIYGPVICHRCSSADPDCSRCDGEGFTVGPDSTPASPVTAPQGNWLDIQRRAS